MIVAVTATLGLVSNIGSAIAARCRHDPFSLVRRLGQWPVLAFARWPLAALGFTARAKIVLRGRNMRIFRGLARLANQSFKLCNPSRQTLDHLILRKQ